MDEFLNYQWPEEIVEAYAVFITAINDVVATYFANRENRLPTLSLDNPEGSVFAFLDVYMNASRIELQMFNTELEQRTQYSDLYGAIPTSFGALAPLQP